MVKCLIFDWYGVCAYEPWINIFTRELEAKLDVPKDKTSVSFKMFLKLYLTDKISGHEFIEKVFKDLELNDAQKFYYLIDKHSDVNTDVMNLILKLKKKYCVVLLSDSFKGVFEKYDASLGGLDTYFDTIFLSHKLKMHKEEECTWNHLIEKVKIEPKDMIFIDDWEKNFVIPKQKGVQCIHFTDYTSLVKKFESMKIL